MESKSVSEGETHTYRLKACTRRTSVTNHIGNVF